MTLNIIPKPNKVEFFGGEAWCDDLEIKFVTDEKLCCESYILEIKEKEIVITSKGEKGKFYALKSLSQLKKMGKVPLCKITDEPAFSYRGFMIDSSRHIQTLDEIKTYINAAAEFKFNFFHWHLCDDQGFRIESEKYPLLNEKGSYRKQWGFGSDNTEPYGGYFTKAEIKEIIDFCAERFIEVIPEIDMPGHTVAILSTFPELSCRGVPIDVETKAGIFKDILCGGNEKVYEFCYNILDEVTELFPCKYIHIGGDEAPKARWGSCEKCQAKIKKEGLKNEEELQGYFVNKMIDYLEKEKGKTVLVWNESLNSGMLKNTAIVCDWMDRKHKCEPYANSGGKIIAEDFYHYYLDYPYGITPLKKTYEFSPYLKKLNFIGRKNVLGVETPIWTEYIEDFDKMCYMCFPRMIACGENGWTKQENKDYESFKVRVENCRSSLKEMGITMADKDEWDPNFIIRLQASFDHIKKSLTPESVKATLFPMKDE
ncbi:MAG: beta-N-acetylhexosaminidase [Acutalibacteraceae bacterium]